MTPIDIVVPYVNNSDPMWLKEFLRYKSNNGDRGSNRFRDLGIFKYFFRGVDKCCPWINNLFLVVQGESQVPKWLNRNNPKIKIVYHDDYIPKSYLPTFNSNVIEDFIYRIPNLSKNFIYCNDDMIFLKPLQPTDFFDNGRPIGVKRIDTESYKKNGTSIFHHMLFNTVMSFNLIAKTGKLIKYKDFHLPIPYDKSIWESTWEHHGKKIEDSLKGSTFRLPKNIIHWLFYYLQMYTGITKDDPNYLLQNGYLSLSDTSKPEDIRNKLDTAAAICINDCIKNNMGIVKKCKDLLEQHFPEKSSYEL